jgi:hypothetical protein
MPVSSGAQRAGRIGCFEAVFGLVTETRHQAVVVDHFDFWSAAATFRMRGCTNIHALTIGKSPVTGIALRILRYFGKTVELVASPFSDRKYAGCYADLTELILSYSSEYVEPDISRRLDAGLFPTAEEKKRTVRYLSLCQARLIKRQVEVLEATSRLRRIGVNASLLVQSSPLDMPFEAFCRTRGVLLDTYSAVFRFRIAPREDFKVHETSLWTGEALLYGFARNAVLMLLAVAGWFAGLVGRRTSAGRADIIALTSRPFPTAEIDDLYWLDELRVRSDGKVWLICTSSLTLESRSFYENRVDRHSSVRQLLSPFSGGLLGRHIHRSGYVRAFMSEVRRAIMEVARRRFPLSYAVSLISLWERVALFEAVLKLTGARIGWSTTEGMELNTQALAIAAARRSGIVVGTTWSLWDIPHFNAGLNRNDILCVAGPRLARLFLASQALVSHYVVTGYPTTHVALRDRGPSDIVDRWRSDGSVSNVICFYDNAYAEDFPVRLPEILAIFDAIVTALENDFALRAIIKTKRPDLLPLPTQLRDRLEALLAVDRVAVRDIYGDLASGLGADAVVGISISTLGLLSAHRGRRCIIYDREGLLNRCPADGLRDLRRVDSVDMLHQELSLLSGAPLPRSSGSVDGDDVDGWADDGAAARTASYLGSLIAAADAPSGRSGLMECANNDFADSFGDLRIISGTGRLPRRTE